MTSQATSYLGYGLTISSPLALHAPTARTAAMPDVVVRRAPLDCPAPIATESGVSARVTADGIYLSCAEVGTFLVRDGIEILVDAVPGVPDGIVRLYLLGPVFAALLRQRGLLVLHASAVAIGGEAVGFLGGPGWGKSTTAGALWARGHEILADDVVAVAETASGHSVMPGFPWLKLWPDASRALGADPHRLPRVHPAREKRDLRMAAGNARPAPLDRVYALAVGDELSIEDLSPQAALVELLRHSFGGQSLQSVETSEHFLRCASLARSVPVRRLTTKRSLATLADIARLVETDRALAAN